MHAIIFNFAFCILIFSVPKGNPKHLFHRSDPLLYLCKTTHPQSLHPEPYGSLLYLVRRCPFKNHLFDFFFKRHNFKESYPSLVSRTITCRTPFTPVTFYFLCLLL